LKSLDEKLEAKGENNSVTVRQKIEIIKRMFWKK
jgi:hypothetical protein